MVRSVVVVVLMQFVLCKTQMYDMSNGNNEEGLKCPCTEDGTFAGRCKTEYADVYPGGPTTGLVFSTDIAFSCIEVPELIKVTQNSNFNMQVHVPYTQGAENMQVILTNDKNVNVFEWFKISGPISLNERWMEFSMPLPPGIIRGKYKVSILDNSNSNKISIRYFEITEEDLPTTTTESTTDSTTESTTDSTTESTTDSTTESTTDSTTESTTDSTTESTTDSTTESTTDSTTVFTTDSTTESTSDSTTMSTTVTTIDSTNSELTTEPITVSSDPTTDSTDLSMDLTTTQYPPPIGSKISVWGLVLGVTIGVTAMCIVTCSVWFLVAGWRRRKRENKPDDMVSLPRLEVIHKSDTSTNSSTIGITGRRTENWVFR